MGMHVALYKQGNLHVFRLLFPKRHEVRRVLLTYIWEEGVGRGSYEGARPEGPRDGGRIRRPRPPGCGSRVDFLKDSIGFVKGEGFPGPGKYRTTL